jgi:hypothetical protein
MRSRTPTGSPSGEVVKSQYHSASRPALIWEGSQPMTGSAKLSFQDRQRVAGNQVHDAFRGTEAREIAGTVHRVKSSIYDVRGVPDVMQPGRSDQNFAAHRKGRRHTLSFACDTLHVRPSSGQRLREQAPRRILGPGRRCHLASLRSL